MNLVLVERGEMRGGKDTRGGNPPVLERGTRKEGRRKV